METRSGQEDTDNPSGENDGLLARGFRAYLHHRQPIDRRTLSGDWAMVARRDPSMPDALTWRELRRYLEKTGASRADILAASQVWTGFKKWRGDYKK